MDSCGTTRPMCATLIASAMAAVSHAQSGDTLPQALLLMPNGSLASTGVYCHDRSPGCASPGPVLPIGTNFWQERKFTGDWGGLRTALSDSGVSVHATSTTDLSTVVSGGQRQGFLMPYLIDVNAALDTQRLGLWEGGRAFIDFQQAGCTQLASKYVPDWWGWDSLNPYTQNYTELAQYWYQQSFADGALKLKFGKIDANADFGVSYTGSNFISQAAYQPGTLAMDLPTYPNQAGGGEVLFEPVKGIEGKFGFFDGSTNYYNVDTGGLGAQTGRTGLASFLWENPGSYFLVAEGGGSWTADDLSGNVAAGWWQQTGESYGMGVNGAQAVQGPWGLYASFSQDLFKPEGGTPHEALTAFGQFAWSPPETNPAQWSLMGGLSWQGILPGRSQDTAGLLTAWTQFSNEPSITTSAGVGEFMFEAFYNVQVTPWLGIQPDVQFVNQPSSVPSAGVPDAVILTVRVAIAF